MKSIYLIIMLAFAGMAAGQSTATTTIYLIRHAEKADGSADPQLSGAGMERAKKWAAYFKDKKIAAIYSTPYKRTSQTVTPVAEAAKLAVTTYNPGQMDLASLAKQHEGQNIIIAGHSNTIPAYVNKIIGENRYPDMNEADFDHLYIITISGTTVSHQLVKV